MKYTFILVKQEFVIRLNRKPETNRPIFATAATLINKPENS